MKALFLVALSVLTLSLSAAAADAPATNKPDDEGFIRNWLVLGPIPVDAKVEAGDEASCKEFLEKEWVPKDAKPKDGEKAQVNGKEMSWHAVQADDYFVDLEKFAKDQSADAEHAVYLGTAYVTAEKDMPEVVLAIGSDDDSGWWVNGKQVITAYAGRAIDKDQNKSEPLTLNKGVNVVKFLVINGAGPTSAAARFLDKDGNPIKDLSITLTPPDSK